MKRLPLLFIMLLCLTTQAKEKENEIVLGGVDVGNGMVIDSGFELKPSFSSEEELIEHFNMIKKKIKEGKHPMVKGLLRLGDCQTNKIDVSSYHFKKYYSLNAKKQLEKSYKGAVKLGLYKCKRPDIVSVSDRTLVSNL